MYKTSGWFSLAVLTVGLLLLGAFNLCWADKPKDAGQQMVNKAIDAGLKDAINRGADIFNSQGDYAGCYRIYQSALITVKPLLGHRPDLQKSIDEAVTKAETLPKPGRIDEVM